MLVIINCGKPDILKSKQVSLKNNFLINFFNASNFHHQHSHAVCNCLSFTPGYNSVSSAGLTMIAPITWPMEWSSRNFFIEKWLLVSRTRGNLHLHLKDFYKCDLNLIWIWKECVSQSVPIPTSNRPWMKIGVKKSEAPWKLHLASFCLPLNMFPVLRGIPWSMDADNDHFSFTEMLLYTFLPLLPVFIKIM